MYEIWLEIPDGEDSSTPELFEFDTLEQACSYLDRIGVPFMKDKITFVKR